MKLTEEEEEQLMNEVDKLPEADKIFELTVSYEEKGKEIGKQEVAIEMLKKELDLNLIAEFTHLDIEELKKLKQELT